MIFIQRGNDIINDVPNLSQSLSGEHENLNIHSMPIYTAVLFDQIETLKILHRKTQNLKDGRRERTPNSKGETG